jgi:molybdopterin/thiamine biosynthesis adenylyltransferase/rhodanese-related sulfurtransferase
MANFRSFLEGIQGGIREIDVVSAAASFREKSAIFVDVRELDECRAGAIPGATLIPRGLLEMRAESAIAPDREVIVYCASGTRSALAARTLAELGYREVSSLTGGFVAWKSAGHPWELPSLVGGEALLRYARHLRLPEVGATGQKKLLDARVLCIGAGGLGSPCAYYLAAAGVGTLGILDDDVVDISNLQRQILHTSRRVGMAKVDSAEESLGALNPEVTIVKHRTRLGRENALDILAGYDVIVDGTDNFQTRYLVNDVALRLGKPVVHASVFRFEGQLAVFAGTGAPCYRCLYPQPPPAGAAPSCQEAGVLGVLPGVLGVMQATEAIKLVLAIGEPMISRLLIYDALAMKFRELGLSADPGCATCGPGVDRSAIPLPDYAEFCGGA